MKRKHLLLCGLTVLSLVAYATPVKVTMNATSATMSLVDSEGKPVDVGQPVNKVYEFEAEPGKYTLTAYDASNAQLVNGTIGITVVEKNGSIFGDDLDDDYKNGIDDVNQFSVITCTAYVSNKHDDDSKSSWTIEGGDYTMQVKVNTREGQPIDVTPGASKTNGRYTFLALNGNSYQVAFMPSEVHQAEGYMTLYRGGTLTANVNVTGAIPMGGEFSITVPSDAELELGMKFTHFSDFTRVTPTSVENADGGKKYNYILANGQVYNYRTWKPGGLTHGGYFTMNITDATKCPVINFEDTDYAKADPKGINHTPQSNNGYETGDLLLNINPAHHLKLNIGEEFLVHGMRMWELTDNSTNNYFFEPDMHYTVLDSNFQPSDKVIEIDNADTTTSAWSTVKAKGEGTAIVLVTYDGINLNYFNNAEKRDYLGGEYWGAIWPENTGVFVVTVGGSNSSVIPNMTVNEEYNMDALRLAGNNVDAEHDVFYYLDSAEGFYFTFKPEGVASIEIATPIVTETEMKYIGFSNIGVSKNEDDSYTILLKEGKTIVRMTDAGGNSAYQVLRAKPCHREITNVTRENSHIFQPGDKVKIQYSGLYHPANKIAGIYNMSAYVTYNGVPNGSSLILGSGQYTFGSAASAQAVTVEIPADYNVEEKPVLLMDEGVIQVNGYGDPIGNHRNTSPIAGRSPNFTAVPHKTYFGAIPEISIPLSAVKTFRIELEGAPEGAEIELAFNGTPIQPDEDGAYSGTYGSYSIVSKAEGYRCFRSSYEIGDDAEGVITFDVAMELLGDAWDGKSVSEPALNGEDAYEIKTPAELAWFATNVNGKGENQNAVLLSDLHLGNFDWTPIGASSTPFSGTFEGAGHTIEGLYIATTNNNIGLFGYMKDGHISGLSVDGSVSGKQYVGGLVGNVLGNSTITLCANHADVTGTGTYVGGVAGYLNSANAEATNVFNTGRVSGTTNCGGVFGSNNKDATVSNIFNVGVVKGNTVGGCIGGTTAKTNVSNAYCLVDYQITENQIAVSAEQMASGEVAYNLGDAFFQTIGVDPWPSFTGLKVYYDDTLDEYYNLAVSFDIEKGEGSDDVWVDADGVVIPVKGSWQLAVVAEPFGARLPAVTWRSGDPEVVAVDETGMLTALSVGETTVSASAVIDGTPVVAVCNVQVAPAEVKELIIDFKDITLSLEELPSAVLTAVYAPEYAEEPGVIWTSSNEEVATIEHHGTLEATVTAHKEGSTTIRVELAGNPEINDSFELFVSKSLGVDSVIMSSDAEVDVYTLGGVLVARKVTTGRLKETLAPGLYIISTSESSYKVCIK